VANSPPTDGPSKEGLRLIYIGIGAFLITCGALFVSASLAPADSDAPPGFPVQPVASELGNGSHRVTLDTSDQGSWIPFSLELGRIVPDGPAADVYIRRQLLQAPYGAVSLGKQPFESVDLPEDPNWVDDITVDDVQQNPVLSRWYSYSYFSHLLTPRDETQAVRLASGKAAIFNVMSYYCENETSGCMTIRYRVIDG